MALSMRQAQSRQAFAKEPKTPDLNFSEHRLGRRTAAQEQCRSSREARKYTVCECLRDLQGACSLFAWHRLYKGDRMAMEVGLHQPAIERRQVMRIEGSSKCVDLRKGDRIARPDHEQGRASRNIGYLPVRPPA